MAIFREPLDQRVKGSLAQEEDFWTLCYDSDANRFYVEHYWSHMDPYNLGKSASDHGTKEHDADTWTGRGSGRIEEAKARLLEKAGA